MRNTRFELSKVDNNSIVNTATGYNHTIGTMLHIQYIDLYGDFLECVGTLIEVGEHSILVDTGDIFPIVIRLCQIPFICKQPMDEIRWSASSY